MSAAVFSLRIKLMAMVKSSSAAEISDIQRRMAQVRHDLHQEVRGAVKDAQSLTDWRSQVRNHPWLVLGAAAAAGYLIVPKRRSESPTIVAVSSPPPVTLETASVPPAGSPRGSRWGMIGTAIGLLAPVAVRAAQNYAAYHLEQWLAEPPGGSGATASSGRTTSDPRRVASASGAPVRPRDPRS